MSFRAQNARAAAGRLGDARAGLRAQELRGEVVTTLSQPGRGREYRRGRKVHRASKPGDAPAVDLGDLRRSIGLQKIGEGHYRVGTNLQKAPLLEFGTRRVSARPFMRPALEKVRARRG